MSSTEADAYITGLNKKVRPIAQAVHDTLISLGCTSYVKTIYIGYDLNGEMVAASYGHGNHVEVALALAEDHPDERLQDASHLTWRTLPLALNLTSTSSVKQAHSLFEEACSRVGGQSHDVHRDNDYFVARKRRRNA